MRTNIVLWVNGKKTIVPSQYSHKMLSDYLRENLLLKGTKIGCGEGDCGACSVLQGSLVDFGHIKLSYKAVNSCLMTLANADSSHIVTIEGVASIKEHPIPISFIKHSGSQCGFCTPGFVISFTSLFEENSKPNEKDLKQGVSGNICRCTGYQSIIDAGADVRNSSFPKQRDYWHNDNMVKEIKVLLSEDLLVKTEQMTMFKPVSEQALLDYKNRHSCSVLAGTTDLGVAHNKNIHRISNAISTGALYSLKKIESIDLEKSEAYKKLISNNGKKYISVGAGVTLSQWEEWCIKNIPSLSDLMRIFASPQIKNAGTVIGNLANGSPVGDLLPFFSCAHSIFILSSYQGKRVVPFQDFYKGYKEFDLKKNEYIQEIVFQLPDNPSSFYFYKVSRRESLDISTVSGCFYLDVFKQKKNPYTADDIDLRISLGGVSVVVRRLSEVEDFIKNEVSSKKSSYDTREELLNEVKYQLQEGLESIISQYVQPISDVRGSKEYRLQLVKNFFKMFIKGERV